MINSRDQKRDSPKAGNVIVPHVHEKSGWLPTRDGEQEKLGGELLKLTPNLRRRALLLRRMAKEKKGKGSLSSGNRKFGKGVCELTGDDCPNGDRHTEDNLFNQPQPGTGANKK